MQVTKTYKIFILISLVLIFLVLASCSSYKLERVLAQKNTNYDFKSEENICNSQSNSQNQVERLPKYQIVSKDCFKQPRCLVFIYINENDFNKSNITILSNFLKEKNKDKEMLQIFFFDDFNKALSHTKGKLEPRDLSRNARGIFYYDNAGEYLKIKLNKNNSSEWIVIYEKLVED